GCRRYSPGNTGRYVSTAAPYNAIREQTMPDMQTSQGSEYVAPTHLTAAAGGRGGSWYVLLEGLASLIHEICPALTITVVEGVESSTMRWWVQDSFPWPS